MRIRSQLVQRARAHEGCQRPRVEVARPTVSPASTQYAAFRSLQQIEGNAHASDQICADLGVARRSSDVLVPYNVIATTRYFRVAVSFTKPPRVCNREVWLPGTKRKTNRFLPRNHPGSRTVPM